MRRRHTTRVRLGRARTRPAAGVGRRGETELPLHVSTKVGLVVEPCAHRRHRRLQSLAQIAPRSREARHNLVLVGRGSEFPSKHPGEFVRVRPGLFGEFSDLDPKACRTPENLSRTLQLSGVGPSRLPGRADHTGRRFSAFDRICAAFRQFFIDEKGGSRFQWRRELNLLPLGLLGQHQTSDVQVAGNHNGLSSLHLNEVFGRPKPKSTAPQTQDR